MSRQGCIDRRQQARRKPFFSPYHRYADNCLQFTWGRQRKNMDIMLKEIPSRSGFCLEVGPGNRELRSFVETLGYAWVGLDILENANVSIIGDGHDLPFAERSFGLAIMAGVMEHLRDPWNALGELHRVLKDDGYFWGYVAFGVPFHDSYFHFSHWGLEQILEDTGFVLLEMRPGASAFLALAHQLITTVGPISLAPLLAQVWMRPLLFLRKTAGWLYVTLKFGRWSEEYQRYSASGQKDPLKYAGHIIFLAKKQA